MDFESRRYGDVTAIIVNVERANLTCANSFNSFACDIIDGGWEKILIDISRCCDIDSTFLGAIVSAYKKVRKVDGDLRLIYNAEKQLPILDITNVDQLFEVHTDLESALASFGRSKDDRFTLTWV